MACSQKGSSFDSLTQWDAYRLVSHINSTTRASLNGMSPFKLARLLLGQDAHAAFKLREIDAANITLTLKLHKK